MALHLAAVDCGQPANEGCLPEQVRIVRDHRRDSGGDFIPRGAFEPPLFFATPALTGTRRFVSRPVADSALRLCSAVGSVLPRARFDRAPRNAGFVSLRMRRQREGSTVGEFQVTAVHLHLALTAAPALDHELGADRETAGKPGWTQRHNILHARIKHPTCRLTPSHPASPMCKSIDMFRLGLPYPRYPQTSLTSPRPGRRVRNLRHIGFIESGS